MDILGVNFMFWGLNALWTVLPLVLVIVGFQKKKTNADLAKKLFISAAIIFLVGLGLCGAMIYSITGSLDKGGY